jgi:capsular exopolysaccharide synthesis family protein
MSRVYDAMRRKAEEQKGTVSQSEAAPTWTSPVGVEEDVLSQLQAENMGTRPPAPELDEDPVARQELRPTITPPAAVRHEPAAPAPAAPAPAAPAPVAPARAAARKELSSPIFEHVDLRYKGKIVLDTAVSPQSREQYRRLAASLHHAQAVSGIKVVMVTSAMVGEGKTLTASNVAMTLSQSYKKELLLVDADFRRPSVHAVFGIPPYPGLAESLTAEQNQKIRVRLVSSGLGVLTGGRPTSDPIAALTSERMRQLVQEARNTFDWVILDTPPVALLTDASLVSAMTDGALIVVKAGETSWDLVERAVNAVGRERTLGVVLNRATGQLPSTGYYDYYNYYSAPVAQ